MSKISMDGIIAYALLKNKKDDSTQIQPSKQVINAEFDDEKLIIVFDDNSTIKAPFSSELNHSNKIILDKISVGQDGKLMYNNQLICDLSEAIKTIQLNEEENSLIIEYFNQTEQKIPLKPIIEKIFNELQQSGEEKPDTTTKGGMFFYKIVKSYNEMNNILKPKIGSTVIVLNDINNNNNEKSLYVYTGSEWQFIGSVENNRDFTKNPINLQKEVFGVLSDNSISNQIARVNQLHSHNNLSILNKLSADNTGNILLYNGKKIISNIFYDKTTRYDDINILKFRDFIGKKNGDILEYRLDISSRELRDMPKDFVNNKILVSNSDTSTYDLKNIDELIDVKENFSTIIHQNEWEDARINGRREDIYKYTINHNLNSTNLIVAFYNNNVNASNYNYVISDENNIVVKSNRNDETKVVINCSQGTTKNKNGNGGGTSTTVDHKHTNLSLLEKFSTDEKGNLFFDGTRIFTNFNPLSYKKVWNQNLVNDLTLLIDYSKLFNEKDVRIVTRSDLLIKNENAKINDENINKKNTVHLQVIEDDTNIVLDTYILPQETQKYEVGINPNTKIYIQGFFSGNLIINYFDTSFVQTNGSSPDIKINEVGITKNQILHVLKTHNFNELDTESKIILEAINELKRYVNSEILESYAELNDKLVSYQQETRDKIDEYNEKIKNAINGVYDTINHIDVDNGNKDIKQYQLFNVESGNVYNIIDNHIPINHKIIANVFTFDESQKIIDVIIDFGVETENIDGLTNGIKMKDNFILQSNENELPVIKKSDFNSILRFQGGV